MTARGIPFASEMVQALLARRKTQTRRVIAPRLLARHDPTTETGRVALIAACPYGRPGDTLYVREAVAFGFTDGWPLAVDYHADGARRVFTSAAIAADAVLSAASLGYITDQRRPSIFMPRWCARLHYDLFAVRVEPVTHITEVDALAEGVAPDGDSARSTYRRLWDALNAPRGYGWDAAPWVYALTLREGARQAEGFLQ